MTTTVTVDPWTQPHSIERPPAYEMHVIVEVTDGGMPALTRYRRAVIRISTDGGSERGCPLIEQGPAPLITDFTESVGHTGAKCSSSLSSLGELVDDPAARAVLDKHLPGLSAQVEGSDQARNMTLSALQHFYPGVTPEILKAIDADLAGLPDGAGAQEPGQK